MSAPSGVIVSAWIDRPSNAMRVHVAPSSVERHSPSRDVPAYQTPAGATAVVVTIGSVNPVGVHVAPSSEIHTP